MIFVFKDYNRKISMVNAVPMNMLDHVKEWLNESDFSEDSAVTESETEESENSLGSSEESGKDWSELEEEAAAADKTHSDFVDDYTQRKGKGGVGGSHHRSKPPPPKMHSSMGSSKRSSMGSSKHSSMGSSKHSSMGSSKHSSMKRGRDGRDDHRDKHKKMRK
ncbi:unnamed protein product [Oppiella nova]|uniref:FACT complex subunit n=1 Tax=Oppiella nova TaxID=334625 RepID=A0A7R9QYS3_9ACAR|nr:unnamed protein product [Oppiella nova]CAG2180537.1 unnamed protein product [Oppiella nova]